jgi:hypothetical protein
MGGADGANDAGLDRILAVEARQGMQTGIFADDPADKVAGQTQFVLAGMQRLDDRTVPCAHTRSLCAWWCAVAGPQSRNVTDAPEYARGAAARAAGGFPLCA